MSTLCDICEEGPPDAGLLSCGHTFCHDCFNRYVHGSVHELRHSLRCCVCGDKTLLAQETRREDVLLCFGRDADARGLRLHDATGITVLSDGAFVSVDRHSKRGYVFDEQGDCRQDFAYIHNTRPMSGLTLTSAGHLAIPFTDGRRSFISYYTIEGKFLSRTYLPADSDVGGITCSKEDCLLVTDVSQGKVYIYDAKRELSKTITVEQDEGEDVPPAPTGIITTLDGHILIADSANHTLRLYSTSGRLLRRLGGLGQRPGEFNQPQGLTMDPDGRVMVADRGNNRVQLLNSDLSYRRFLVRYNAGADAYMAPDHLAVAAGDRVVVLLTATRDACVSEVRLYTTDGPQM